MKLVQSIVVIVDDFFLKLSALDWETFIKDAMVQAYE
jgi:hypothetical protein